MLKKGAALSLAAILVLTAMTACGDSHAAQKGSGVGGLIGNDLGDGNEIVIHGSAGLDRLEGETQTAPTTTTRTPEEAAQTTASSPDNAVTSSMYAAYDGYVNLTEDGRVRFQLETRDGFKIRCFFLRDAEDIAEEVYTVSLNRAVATEGAMMVRSIKDGNGREMGGKFEQRLFSFSDGEVIMKVRRDEKTLAGGEGDNITTGSYVFKPARTSTKATKKKKS